jgi:hypothetical protein
MPCWPGKYHHAPCDRCGYATRYKQFPLVCACTTPDRCPHPPISVQGDYCQRCGGDARVPRENMNGLAKYIEEIWAEQEQKNAALRRRVSLQRVKVLFSSYLSTIRPQFVRSRAKRRLEQPSSRVPRPVIGVGP